MESPQDQITLRIGAETAERLDWLASRLKQDRSELAQAIFDFEVEAQYCLSRGPWLRKYMYRGSEPYWLDDMQRPEGDPELQAGPQ